jgi:hypothetical protein
VQSWYRAQNIDEKEILTLRKFLWNTHHEGDGEPSYFQAVRISPIPKTGRILHAIPVNNDFTGNYRSITKINKNYRLFK